MTLPSASLTTTLSNRVPVRIRFGCGQGPIEFCPATSSLSENQPSPPPEGPRGADQRQRRRVVRGDLRGPGGSAGAAGRRHHAELAGRAVRGAGRAVCGALRPARRRPVDVRRPGRARLRPARPGDRRVRAVGGAGSGAYARGRDGRRRFHRATARARPSRPGRVADAGLHPSGRARSGRSRPARPRAGDDGAAVRASGSRTGPIATAWSTT